ncbi:heavy metal translocating P-type ATPase [Marinicrinis lubricantis]|uniref:Cd(2+)-exporting ATPase n=1 Tax=Marinicrinis lubricantis TaxID=2086470 RepID=A0ABW1IMD6_9BACL
MASDTQNLDKTVYRVQGFTCTNCAGIFEKNVKNLQGVKDAKVNFGASKITVYGSTTTQELEQAGAFENLKVIPEKERFAESKKPFWREHWNVLVSALLLAVGFGLGLLYDDSLSTSAAYGAAIVLGGYDLFIKGFKSLARLQFDMNTLMTVAIIGAALIGEWAEGASVVILFAISEALERYSMEQARHSIRSLMDIAPKEALIKRGSEEMIIHVEDISVGDVMIVKPGQKIAMDGVILKGASTVNQSAITGESIPVPKTVDDEVFAGTLNEEGLLEVLVTKTSEDTTLSKIIHLVEEAQAERAPSQAFVDRFAKYYTPVIMILALCTAVLPPLFTNAGWGDWIYRGLALLVVGCPCALVISTPVSIVTAIGNAAKNGVLIKGGIHLEESGRLAAIAFDKTGTLTKGYPVVTNVTIYVEQDLREILAAAAVLEKGSQHPLASAIIRKAEQEGVNLSLEADQFQSVTGKGVRGIIGGKLYRIGSPAWMMELLPSCMTRAIQEQIKTLQHEGKTVILLAAEQEIAAMIAISDEIRESATEVIHQLHSMGLTTVMLTGDNERTAQAIGRRVEINEINADLMPQHKLDAIKKLRERYDAVAMVGDGVNDAPALAAATVGMAMGGAGTDTALETADIALMADDLRKLPYTIKLSRRTLSIIKQNIAFSIGIKLIALALIGPGWLTLWMAVFADMGATLIVTLNSLRLLKVHDLRQ